MCEEEPEVLDDKLEAGSQTQHTGGEDFTTTYKDNTG